MANRPLILNPSFRAMARGTRELHQLIAAGKEDSAEADAIRDATDGPWEALSEIERDRIRNLSEDLYSLNEPAQTPKPMSPQTQAKLNEAYEAKQKGDWDRTLQILRRWREYIDPALLSYLRGSIWLDAGDPGTAALFFNHAYKLSQIDEHQYLYLIALDQSDPIASQKRASEILSHSAQYSPALVSQAAGILFTAATSHSEQAARNLIPQIVPLLKDAIERLENQDAIREPVYVATLSLLGACYEYQGSNQEAIHYYTLGLNLEPYNEALLAARGLLLYGASPRSITDLELAIRSGTSLIWPSVFLAHHKMINGQFDECRKICERALTMKGSPAVMSELSEWLAISQAELVYPAEVVRASFEQAIRYDPSNERALRNLSNFESKHAPITLSGWETRTSGALRTFGLSERRFGIAA